MLKVFLGVGIGLLLLATSHCGKSQTEPSSKTIPEPSPESHNQIICDWNGDVLGDKPTDLQKFLIGRWEGREWPEQQAQMQLTFQEDGTVIIDYSVGATRGVIFHRPYRIKDDKTINICGYPDNFTVAKQSNNETDLRSDSKEIRAVIELIYGCRFKRIKS